MPEPYAFSRYDSDFISHGVRCAGWLYLPGTSAPPPVVVMAHGFAGERNMGLTHYAESFARRGLAVFLFDYRTFGDSDGHPRNMVSPNRHLQDWRAAVSHVRGLARVDGSRTALWGTSFSGGHVMTIAAMDPAIRAIIAQVPFVDGRLTVRTAGWPYLRQAMLHGFRDLLRAASFRSPHYVPVVADPGRFAVMNGEDAVPAYQNLLPEGSCWENKCPGRALLTAALYLPIAGASAVTCPALVIAAEHDRYIPFAGVAAAAARMPRAELIRLPIGHFEVYTGKILARLTFLQEEFLVKHLAGTAST